MYADLSSEKALPLFAGWEETIVWSCLDGTMGELFGNEETAAAYLGDFAFFAGKPSESFLHSFETMCKKNFLILAARDPSWNQLFESYYEDRVKKVQRYAIRKERNIFDPDHLQKLSQTLPCGFQLQEIDKGLYENCLNEAWSRDLVSQYPTWDDYEALGMGMAVTYEGTIVSGASSYSRYRNGIEIEIDTHPSFRRMGLAAACGAGLILKCLREGLYPSWDAQNLWSVALAEKLGYHLDHPYDAYELRL